MALYDVGKLKVAQDAILDAISEEIEQGKRNRDYDAKTGTLKELAETFRLLEVGAR